MGTAKKKPIEDYGDPPSRIDPECFYGYTLDTDQAKFANAIWDKNVLIVFANAMAGSGKTFIATGVADMLVKYVFYDGIVYIVSSYGERRQGYLPGNITEKSEVYFEPFYQALQQCGVNTMTAITITAGTNTPETLSAILAIGAFVAAASLTICMIREKVVSSPTRLAFALKNPD